MKSLICLLALTASLLAPSISMAETTYQIRVPFDPGATTKQDDENTLYASCSEILNAGKSTGDGVYTLTINADEVPVYCDMTRDGGGWMLTHHFRGYTPEQLHFKDVAVSTYPIKTYSIDTASYPVLPYGTVNNFSEQLFAGGKVGLHNYIGGQWFKYPMHQPANFPIANGYTVTTSSGGTWTMYARQRGWDATSKIDLTYISGPNKPAEYVMSYWPHNGKNGNVCGGSGTAGKYLCVFMIGNVSQLSGGHEDITSDKFIFVR